jgi:hypothetical protein
MCKGAGESFAPLDAGPPGRFNRVRAAVAHVAVGRPKLVAFALPAHKVAAPCRGGTTVTKKM